MNILTNTSKTAVDPVCGMKVNPRKTELTFEFQGNSYYFCAEACLNTFESDPQKYLVTPSKTRKSWWGRYMERLSKATGGNPPKCCG